jgi:hypothetical protein
MDAKIAHYGQITRSAGLAGLRIGDKIKLGRAPNSKRFFVTGIVGASCVDVGCYTRPSKGFRKHIRRNRKAPV